ncbi:MAG TPA: ATP-binding protein [Rhizomicrobium sp.]|nr:ATP-binding protein [Rhizomicrobium sp.]
MARQPGPGEKEKIGKASGYGTRMLQARLDLMVASMPSAIWLNTCVTVSWMLPFTGLFPLFGTIHWPTIGFVIVMQVLMGLAARPLYRGYRRDPECPDRWLRRLAIFQAATGVLWGMVPWLIWVDGNLLNNVLVTTTICAYVWAYSLTRAMHAGVYLSGVIPTVALTIARIVYGGGPIALPLVVITLITFCVVFSLTYGLRRSVEVMLRIRFANDDLAVELRDTRDDALRKRFEAEAANASKTTFLANMSHELRTPLNAILGFSELIASETLGPVGTARYRDYAGDINESGRHLLSLINDILDIAKIESGKLEIAPTIIDPKSAIDGALNVIQLRLREKGQTIAVEIGHDVDGLYSDERAFKQIVINLLSNAVKFTPDRGHISISLKSTANGGCELCVSDNGPGISASLLDQIFMPFNQVDNRYCRQAGGTGLGLSLVRGLAQLHGGTAWIESDTGKGVKAYVEFPPPPRAPLRRTA